ncbi:MULTISPECIES: hypothetical protein [unclassified Knoellia]|uniref:hypothetical protein n=1 Tax=Knoellia altitudinis TaxID=3404795 RepID=UPI00360C582D
MPRAQASTAREAEHDAELCCAVAVACSLAFLVFVALPVHADALEIPVALEGLWPVGLLVGAFLGPVAAALAAFASASVLWGHGPRLTQRARRLHCSTIMVSTVLLVAYVASSSALRTWLD